MSTNQPIFAEMEFMLSEKGRRLLVYDNYKFYKQYNTQEGLKWRCVGNKCSAKIYTDEYASVILKTYLDHNHDPDTNWKRQAVSNIVKSKAMDELAERPTKLIKKEISIAPSEYTENFNVTDIRCIQRNLNRARRSILPALPKSATDTEVHAAIVHAAIASVNIKTHQEEKLLQINKADIAVIGLTVMGQNLILNMIDNGFVVCAFSHTGEKIDKFLKNVAKGTKVISAKSMQEMVMKLEKPRRVMLLDKAGDAVDDFIKQLVPLLEAGDIIIDGGNSEYTDTTRRCKDLKVKEIHFVGTGVSGSEEGAIYGPSLMPGGAKEAWPHIKNIFQSISAKVDDEPCCDWVGDEGSGHFAKMVHNGIEYGDMQLISEAYHLLKDALELDHDKMSEIFDEWNKGELDSFLIEITSNILKYKQNGEPLVTKIRDSAGQKSTGKYTAIAALEYGQPVTLIGEAVFARCLSSLKDDRVAASKYLEGPKDVKYQGNQNEFIEHIRKALYASKIVSYAQSFMLLREAAKVFKWELNYGGIALMWRGGCIIKSVFLGNIKTAFEKNPQLTNLLMDEFFYNAINKCQVSWRHVITTAVTLGIPTPALSSALAFYDGFRSKTLPANLIQAQRDYFGAHTYELLKEPGTFIHTNWTGLGGNVSFMEKMCHQLPTMLK